jgi:bifunctional lysine-specific demethylase and histidyl-hydroxylase NO66
VTSTLSGGGTGQRSGVAALRRLVGDDTEEFAATVWGREVRLTRGRELGRSFADLLDADAVDELVSRRGLRTPFLRVAQDGTTLGDRAFTAGAGVGAGVADQVSDDKLVRLFAEGATMVLQGLHRLWPPLIGFSQELAADLGHPVQVNAYVTPPQSRGFSDHYDVHDVFVLQVEGEKRWRIHAPVLPAPLRTQPWTGRRADVEAAARTEPVLDVVLRPGDCLYLPRGYLHAATALGGVSTHLTIGVHAWNGHVLAEQLLAAALDHVADDEDVRGSLPLGVNVSDPTGLSVDLELVRARVLRAVQEASVSEVASRMAARARSAQRAAPVGPLAQLRACAALGDAVLTVRPHLAPALEPQPDGSCLLRSRAGDLLLRDGDVDAVLRLLDREAVPAAELGEDLARRLLLSGVAVQA